MTSLITCLLLTICVGLAYSDYPCVCNYNIDKPVYPDKSTTGTPLGSMYEFDCKPAVGDTNVTQWLSVAFENKLGFVEIDPDTQVQVCAGDIPDEDKLPTMGGSTTTTTNTTPLPTTTGTQTTTAKQTKPTTNSTTMPITNEGTKSSPMPTTVTTPMPTTVTTPMPTTVTTPMPTTVTTPMPTTVTTPMPTTVTTPMPTTVTTTPMPTTVTTTPMPTTQTTTVMKTTMIVTGDLSTSAPTTIPTTTMPTTTPSTMKPTTTPIKTMTTTPPTTSMPKTTPTTVTMTMSTTTPMPSSTPMSPTTPTPTYPSSTMESTTIPTTTSAPTTAMPTTVPQATQTGYGCSQQLITNATGEKGTLFTYGHNCYEIIPDEHTFGYAERECQKRGGHLAHITSQAEQDAVYQIVRQYHGDHVWIGLHDEVREEHFQWTSGDRVNFTYWYPGRKDTFFHGLEDCVAMWMGSHVGRWEDVDCTKFLAYLCEFDAVLTPHAVGTTMPPSDIKSDGNIHLCPSVVQHAAQSFHYILGQFEDSCYEIHRTRVSWAHAEHICEQRGGHLAEIGNAHEQEFAQAFLSRHSANYASWLGLSDHHVEGHLEWTNGATVSYTNWVSGHHNNFGGHNVEDCVAIIPYKGGKWDDISCGRQGFTGADRGEAHYSFCEYKTAAGSPASVLVG